MSADSRPRSVLVTGAADGIGRATAAAFLEAGDRVAMLEYDAAKLERTAAELRTAATAAGDVLAIQTDVRDSTSVWATVAQVVGQFGRLDVAVSNAGIYPNT